MKTSTLVITSLAALTISFTAQASELFGVEFSGLTDLFSANQNNGLLTSIGPSGQDNIGDLTSDTRAGSHHIWGVRIASNQLFEFNPVTGAATLVSTMNSPNNMVSLAFDPVGGKLYGNTSVGFGAPFDALYEIDPGSGNTTFVGNILFQDVFALSFDQTGNLFGVSDTTDQLISINTTTGNGSLIAALPLGFSFDIASRPEDDVMFLADSGTSSLYTLDTSSGAVDLVGAYGQSKNIVGLAFLPTDSTVPDGGATLLLTSLGLGALGLVRRRSV
jgi:hypothetical protein